MIKKSLFASLSLFAALLIGPGGASAEEKVTVRVGVTPYFDYMPWVVADKLGLDEELGIDLELVNITSTARGVAAMRQGSLDVVSSCHVCDFPLYASVPELRSWLITNQFKGFMVVGREGQPTYADLSKTMDPEAAKKQILEGMKGKEFALVLSNFEKLLTAALGQVGMGISDVKVTQFSDDAAAALAFQRGTGDYYMGSLPQEAKLIATPGYVNVGGHEILGPAGLWFSTMVSTNEWLTENPETVKKLVAIWLRFARYASEDFDRVAPLWVEATNERAGAAFTVEEFKQTMELLYFPTVEQAQKTIYNPQSEAYWKNSVDFYKGHNAAELPEGVDPDSTALEQSFFEAVLADAKLAEWIGSPLK
jgi:ABC-type nitrate/sulfonate/bicarbonate transport system substrate-binding protein